MKIRLKVSSKSGGTFLFEHDGPIITIGRDPEADLSVQDTTVSWHHSRIELHNGTAVVHDLQSSNGTYVNAKLISKAKSLRLNSVIQLGKTGPKLKVKELQSIPAAPGSPSNKYSPTVLSAPQPVVGVPVAIPDPSAAPVGVMPPPAPRPRRRTAMWAWIGATIFFLWIGMSAFGFLFWPDNEPTEDPIKIAQIESEEQPSPQKNTPTKPAQTKPSKLAGDQIYDRVMQSSALMLNIERKGKRFAFTQGSGSIISRNPNLILTNYHVVRDEPEMQVFFPHYNAKGELIAEKDHYLQAAANKQGMIGKVVALNKKADLALLKVDAPLPDRLKVLPISRKSVRSGQTVHSVGNPGASAGSWVYTSGSVRQVVKQKRQSKGPGISFLLDAKIIETQSPTNPGDSGGPLVNDYGELVGVTQGFEPGARNVSLFVHMDEVREFLKTAGYEWTDGS